MGTPTVQLRLRGGTDQRVSRLQDNSAHTLEPVAQALSKTPIMGAPPPAWIYPALANGFTNLGGGNSVSAYHQDALGYEWIQGIVSNAAGVAGGTIVFTLDPTHRPASTIIIPVWSSVGAGQAISIDPTGNVFCQAAVGAGGWITLNLSFLAEV